MIAGASTMRRYTLIEKSMDNGDDRVLKTRQECELTGCCFDWVEDGPAIGFILAVGGSILTFSTGPELVEGLEPCKMQQHPKLIYLLN